MATSPPVIFESSKQLRNRFNKGRYVERAAHGEFTLVPGKSDTHLTRLTRGMPPCTRSQIVAYIDAGGRVRALAHRYLLADGTLGASGKPDPKYLSEGGVIYKQLPP